MAACSKSSGGSGGGTPPPPPPPAEQNLAVSITPDPGSPTTPVKATGASYPFNVVVTSTMPTLGVEVKVHFRRDSDGTLIANNDYTFNSLNSTIPVTISNMPLNEVGTVTIQVTSKSKATNTITKTFKLVRK
jgi:hypothetical protein